MSVKVMTAVWPLRIPAFDKLVLLALADISDDEGRCYPSVRKLIEKCGMSERTVQRSIERLEGCGHLAREFRDGRSTIYRVTPVTQTPLPPSDRHPRHSDTPVTVTPTPVSLTPPEKEKTLSLDPSLTPSKGERRASAKKPQPEPEGPPPSNLNVEAWHRWVEYRKQIRKPIKPASVAAAQRQLAGFGPDQAAIVEQSIANGWQGVFALKEQRMTNTKPHKAAPTTAELEAMEAAREHR